MRDVERLLKFIEELLYDQTGNYLSDLQYTILVNSLTPNRKTYDEIAQENSYSAKYIKQDVAPKLWQLLSQVLGQKVTKQNVQAILRSQLSSQQNSADLELSREPLEQLSSRGLKGNLNILLIDDQPHNLKVLSTLLEEQGYEIQQAINGSVALKAIALLVPDLILLDIMMPDLDGYQLCQKLKSREETKDVPIIFMSALDEPWDKVKGFSVGGSDYITKPFKVVEVLARVEHQLNLVSMQKELKELRDRNEKLSQKIQELQKTNQQLQQKIQVLSP